MNIIPYPALATVTTPRTRRTIELIMLHSTGGVKSGDLWTLTGRDPSHQVSCHYYITKLGELYQLVQDKDIAWHAGVCRTWNGKNVGSISLGVELENLNDGRDAYTPAQLATAVALVRAKRDEYRLARDRVIRHADWAWPKGRRTDPVNLDWSMFMELVSATENIVHSTKTFTRRYRVKDGGATIRQAWWRPGPHEPSNIAGQLAPGTLVEVDSLHVGETVEREDLWAHLSDERGFVIASALERA